jgi:hypothetical protein
MVKMNREGYSHILWIDAILKDLLESDVKPIHPDWDSKESYKSVQLARATSDFSNLSGQEKRDIFLFLCGWVLDKHSGLDLDEGDTND